MQEWSSRFIAQCRPLLSNLNRFANGHPRESSEAMVSWVFLRALGLVYLLAFLSLWPQLPGLVGSSGILPAGITMQLVHQEVVMAKIGLDRYHLMPTLCWLDASDGFLRFQCGAGVVLSLLLLLGIAPALCLFLLWLVYLSLATVCRELLAFQWDALLLETGFLAIFLAPLQLCPRLGASAAPPRLAIWLLRWLLFRLLFQSGCLKLLSGDASWRNLTALKFHYETQPLPTWIGWYMWQLPMWAHKVCALIVLGAELLVPFLIFAPRRLRQGACAAIITVQIIILLTGNYGIMNLLTIALSLLLLDDAVLGRVMPAKWRARFQLQLAPQGQLPEAQRQPPAVKSEALRWPGFLNPTGWWRHFLSSVAQGSASKSARWPRPALVLLAGVVLLVSATQFIALFGLQVAWPRPIAAVCQWVAPFRSVNTYGLFAQMTTVRPEIVIEGSNDGSNWLEYEFKHKPGCLTRASEFIAPFQPRLDWQTWLAALGTADRSPWFGNFCYRLLQNKPQVLGLLRPAPFRLAPPRFLRAMLYEYHFTTSAVHRRTGAWWRREPKGVYVPAFSLAGPGPIPKAVTTVPKTPVKNPAAQRVR